MQATTFIAAAPSAVSRMRWNNRLGTVLDKSKRHLKFPLSHHHCTVLHARHGVSLVNKHRFTACLTHLHTSHSFVSTITRETSIMLP